MTNQPTFSDFIAERVGHRDWYTSPRPRPVTAARYREYIAPSRFNAIKREFQQMFGAAA